MTDYNLKRTLDDSPRIKKIINDFEYCLGDSLGKGQYSQVFRGLNTNTGQDVAIKVITNAKLDSVFSRDMLNNEISSLKTLNSPYILQFIKYIYTPNNQYIITEYCNQGELKLNRNYTEVQIMKIFNCLLLALKELKNKKIIHRDIKPSNILMHDGLPKLADFGFSVGLQFLELQNSSYGTPLYMSPESLLQNIDSFQSDVWSVGITMYELIYGCVPFYHRLEQELKKILFQYTQDQILRIPDSQFKPLLQRMLDPNPNTRITVEKLLEQLQQNVSLQNQPQSTTAFLINISNKFSDYHNNIQEQCIRWGAMKILLARCNLDDCQYSRGLQMMTSMEQQIKQKTNDPSIINLLNYRNEQQFATKLRILLNERIKKVNSTSLTKELLQFDSILMQLYY